MKTFRVCFHPVNKFINKDAHLLAARCSTFQRVNSEPELPGGLKKRAAELLH